MPAHAVFPAEVPVVAVEGLREVAEVLGEINWAGWIALHVEREN
jgi:hypothetical protein